MSYLPVDLFLDLSQEVCLYSWEMAIFPILYH